MIRRNIEDKVRMALVDTPVVFLTGARQTGKTTLVREIAKDLPGVGYISLDDLSAFALASSNPQGFLDNLPRPVILDEVQKVPALFDAIKREVDRNHTPGQFLLTGSAHLLIVPALSRALVGRVEILPLFPFSQGELVGCKERWLDRVFAEGSITLSSDRLDAKALAERLVLGGYPAAVQRSKANRREAWFASYLTTLLQRDVRDLSRIEGLGALSNLLSLVAARSASLLNVAELARSNGLPATTLNRYFALLEGLFLVM
ncbi:MAG: AAA family ATPase, partial [Coprothermobacterota bacterium]|nr:AAA family ATPase [Coprothermobacterota bacterium]